MSEVSQQQTPAGWYPHHSVPGVQRYWDGQAWTRETRFAEENRTQQVEATRRSGPFKPRANIMGFIGLGLGVLGFIFACTPGLLVGGWVLLPIAFVLGVIAVCLKGRAKWPGIATILVTVVGTIAGVIVFFAVVASALNSTFSSPGEVSISGEGELGGPSNQANASEAQSSDVGSRENPAVFGSVIENDDWTVILTGFNPDATSEVLAANSFNSKPADAQTWVIVDLSATYKGSGEASSIAIQVDYVTKDGTVISTWDSMATGIDPKFGQANLYAGATDTGKSAFIVPSPVDGLIRVKPGTFAKEVFFKLP